LKVAQSDRTNAHLPAGVRLYAVGDIHGRLDLLENLLNLIEGDREVSAGEQPVLVFLGDYVDRGPDSKGVVEKLLTGLPQGFTSLFLKGNHEELLLSFLRDPGTGMHWLHNGGDATLLSYGVKLEVVEAAFFRGGPALAELAERFRSLLPEPHLKFYESLKLYYRSGDYFFVHGGVRPGVALDRQSEDDMLWIREEFLDWPHDFGAVVVHGHTPVRVPDDRDNRIGIDTFAVRTGILTAAGLEGCRRWFLSTR
jgi:serine/threonine protein phosphatase 1